MKLDQRQVQHFSLRAGFGHPYEDILDAVGSSHIELFEQQSSQSMETKSVKVKIDLPIQSQYKKLSEKEKEEVKKQRRKLVRNLNASWMRELANSKSQLREKMAFFWHDHFACKSSNPVFAQQYLDIIRKNALGNFGDLLREISKSPAMLSYLNNQQNKKSSPNENFAREVMELFTLGRDHIYTENDIAEAARAFTGWTFDPDGSFVFAEERHDTGMKNVLGKKGNFDGDDVINMLLAEPHTAHYLAHKWVKFFMSIDGDRRLEKRIAKELLRTDYNILSGLEVLFTSRSFYRSEHIGTRIKSPIELITSMQRQLHVKITDENSLLYLQQMLGQVIFSPPNVSGWPVDGREWVDSASLIFRIDLPQLMFKAALIKHHHKSFDDNDQFTVKGQLRKLRTTIDFKKLERNFESLPMTELSAYLLQTDTPIRNEPGDFIDNLIYLTSKPEFQLC
ncbi:MAG: DUF1800 domain-containing protein [Cyclobacteriaceae bacterium]